MQGCGVYCLNKTATNGKILCRGLTPCLRRQPLLTTILFNLVHGCRRLHVRRCSWRRLLTVYCIFVLCCVSLMRSVIWEINKRLLSLLLLLLLLITLISSIELMSPEGSSHGPQDVWWLTRSLCMASCRCTRWDERVPVDTLWQGRRRFTPLTVNREWAYS